MLQRLADRDARCRVVVQQTLQQVQRARGDFITELLIDRELEVPIIVEHLAVVGALDGGATCQPDRQPEER